MTRERARPCKTVARDLNGKALSCENCPTLFLEGDLLERALLSAGWRQTGAVHRRLLVGQHLRLRHGAEELRILHSRKVSHTCSDWFESFFDAVKMQESYFLDFYFNIIILLNCCWSMKCVTDLLVPPHFLLNVCVRIKKPIIVIFQCCENAKVILFQIRSRLFRHRHGHSAWTASAWIWRPLRTPRPSAWIWSSGTHVHGSLNFFGILVLNSQLIEWVINTFQWNDYSSNWFFLMFIKKHLPKKFKELDREMEIVITDQNQVRPI